MPLDETCRRTPRPESLSSISAEPEPRRIEVTVSSSADGRRQVVLQDLSFGSGIGWYAQKTIRLDPQQVEALMGALCCVRQNAAMDRLREPAQPQRDQKIIQLEAHRPRRS
jgi:hypothetical protein